MTDPNARRHAGGTMPVLPWVIAGFFALIFIAIGAVWSAAQFAAGEEFTVPGYGGVAGALKEHGLTGLIGPDGSTVLFYSVLIAEVVLVLAALITAAVLVARRGRPKDGHRAMASRRAFADLQQPMMAKRAQGLRPSLAGTRTRDLTARQIGCALGDIGGARVFKSFEDVSLVICGPRSNKTSAIVVPEILSAPGAVVATSNKGDVWALTARLRAKVGDVYLFDPAHITYQPQAWWWNPLRCVTNVRAAARMATYFMREAGLGSEREDVFFTNGARDLLEAQLLAAASANLTLRDVLEWIATRSGEPAVRLDRAGYTEHARMLRSTLELPWETKGGIFQGAVTALSCLSAEDTLRWVTPPQTWKQPPANPDDVPELDLWLLCPAPTDTRFPTLYLVCREGAGTARPIVAAIVGELFEIASAAADARGGRLDPPMTVQLDEAANIVRGLADLPAWYSWFGSKGLMVTTVLQSREQGRNVWTRNGFDSLWSAATIKIVGAGVADPEFAEDISRLVGDHKVEETSTSSSAGGQSVSRSLRTERILTAADIAAIPKTNAVLISPGRRAGMLTLRPWYAERDEQTRQINEVSQQATADIQQAAIAFLGPDNPVAAALMAERAYAAGGSA